MINKLPKIKTLFDGDLYLLEIEKNIAVGLPYSITQSNYTLAINNEYAPIYFMQNVMSNKAFIAANMIKADIKNKGLEPPDIEQDSLQYYKFSLPGLLKKNKKNVIYNIDIKSAYANVLRNNLIITPATFGYLAQLDKQDRLASVGMLASNKNHFFYEAGELVAIQNERNPLANFFFFCIREIQTIMDKIKFMLGNDFLFYWVDGVYFNNIKNRGIIEEYLRGLDYKNSFETLTDFTTIENKRNHTIYFKKENGTPKIFRVGKTDLSVNKEIINILGLFDDKYKIITKKQ